MYISCKRVWEAKAPFELCVEIANDWTHFVHLHRKSHKSYRLLYRAPGREIFHYQARILYPFPLFTDYIVMRNEVPERHGHEQIYLHVKSGRVTFQRSTTMRDGDKTQVIGEYIFDVPSYWRPFSGIFFWIFKYRMRKVMWEDNEQIVERMRSGIRDNPTCAPSVPTTFDLFEDLKLRIPKADVHYEDHVYEDLTART